MDGAVLLWKMGAKGCDASVMGERLQVSSLTDRVELISESKLGVLVRDVLVWTSMDGCMTLMEARLTEAQCSECQAKVKDASLIM